MFDLSFPRRAALALAVGLLVSLTADAQPARPDLSARLQRVTAALDLSVEQRSALDAIASRYADADRSALWQVAADVEGVLTDAQVAELREGMEALRSERREVRGERPAHRRVLGRRGQRQRPARPRGERPRLTDEQRQSLRDAREAHREQMQGLVERLRAGAISGDAFVAQSRALREQAEARRRALLPAEQRERLAEAEARREAVKQACETALGLTDAQKDDLQARALDRIRQAPERLDLRPYLNEDGQLDRQAFREAQREQREALRAQREAAREQADDILTADQQAIVTVHRALAGGGRGTRGGRRAGRGQRLGR